jgi:hypothetical protein
VGFDIISWIDVLSGRVKAARVSISRRFLGCDTARVILS